MAQSSDIPKRRGPGRPFAKGSSGNPGGRPAGFGELIRRETNDGAELVALALGVLRGEVSVRAGDVDIPPTIKERLEACRWLGDRGWGTPTQSLELSGRDGEPLTVEVRLIGPEGG